MSYRIEKNEALSDALGRIAAEEIALAVAELRRPNRAEAMHNTRKSLKRLRSLLRSLRVVFPEDVFRRENHRLAAAGRKIAPLRDVHVKLRTLEKLHTHKSTTKKIEKDLLRHEQAFIRKIPALRRAVRQMLSESREIFAALPAARATPEHLAAGLQRVYKRGRDAFKSARQKTSPENLHEWRKQVKTLGHGLVLIEPLCPKKKAATMMQGTEQLGEALGDDHDFFLVLQVLHREDAARPARDYRRLARRICAKRDRLQKEAFKLGKKIFEEKPRQFGERLHNWLTHNASKK